MRKVTAGLFLSLDGVVESPEKWQLPYLVRGVDRLGRVNPSARLPHHAAIKKIS